jgi:hypothetical protein
MILEGVRIGANAVRSWLQRRKQKKAERKAAKAEAKASVLEKKVFQQIGSGDSANNKMVFASVESLPAAEKNGVMEIFKKYWPVALGVAGLFLIFNFFKRKRR